MKRVFTFIIPLLFIAICSCKKDKGLLTDAAGILSDSEEQVIRQKLGSIDTVGKYRLYIYTVTGGDTIENYHHRETFLNNIKKEQRASTVLVYVAAKDRKINIRTGRYIMYHLTDSLCLFTINRIKPHFKKGNYYKGLNEGISTIDSIVKASGF